MSSAIGTSNMPVGEPVKITDESLTGPQLRALGSSELAQMGDLSLRSHIVSQAMVAHAAHAPVNRISLMEMLENSSHVRHKVELIYDVSKLATHQFAQPEPDADRYHLYLHPGLEKSEDAFTAAVAFFIPLINYGSDLVTDDHCLLYGATLLGMTADHYYDLLCGISDRLGMVKRFRSEDCQKF
jgi:hypothetical protein